MGCNWEFTNCTWVVTEIFPVTLELELRFFLVACMLHLRLSYVIGSVFVSFEYVTNEIFSKIKIFSDAAFIFCAWYNKIWSFISIDTCCWLGSPTCLGQMETNGAVAQHQEKKRSISNAAYTNGIRSQFANKHHVFTYNRSSTETYLFLSRLRLRRMFYPTRCDKPENTWSQNKNWTVQYYSSKRLKLIQVQRRHLNLKLQRLWVITIFYYTTRTI
jgi:hypothetical protein